MLRHRTNAYWQKRSTERVALLERQSEPYIRKVNAIYSDARRNMIQQMKAVYSGYYTSRENTQDAKKKGRMARGAKNAKTIMSEADVIKIASDRRISRVIAEEHNCSAKNVRNIKNGTTWGWLTGIKKSTSV